MMFIPFVRPPFHCPFYLRGHHCSCSRRGYCRCCLRIDPSVSLFVCWLLLPLRSSKSSPLFLLPQQGAEKVDRGWVSGEAVPVMTMHSKWTLAHTSVRQRLRKEGSCGRSQCEKNISSSIGNDCSSICIHDTPTTAPSIIRLHAGLIPYICSADKHTCTARPGPPNERLTLTELAARVRRQMSLSLRPAVVNAKGSWRNQLHAVPYERDVSD